MLDFYRVRSDSDACVYDCDKMKRCVSCPYDYNRSIPSPDETERLCSEAYSIDRYPALVISIFDSLDCCVTDNIIFYGDVSSYHTYSPPHTIDGLLLLRMCSETICVGVHFYALMWDRVVLLNIRKLFAIIIRTRMTETTLKDISPR